MRLSLTPNVPEFQASLTKYGTVKDTSSLLNFRGSRFKYNVVYKIKLSLTNFLSVTTNVTSEFIRSSSSNIPNVIINGGSVDYFSPKDSVVESAVGQVSSCATSKVLDYRLTYHYYSRF